MQKIIRFLIPLFIFLMLLIPVFSFAAGLVPCGTNNPETPLTNHPCEFNDALTLVNTIIKFILFTLAVPIAAIMFFYAGFKMVTSGGSAEARGQAKNIFSSTVFGLVVAAGAWLIIRTLLLILGYKGDWIGF